MSTYVAELNAFRQQETHLAKHIKDQWRTPDWLYQAVNHLYGPIVLDLFTDGQNSKCPNFYTAEDNALAQPWAERMAEIQLDTGIGNSLYNIEVAAFANPPYSQKRAGKEQLTGMTHIMAKADAERKLGAKTIWITKSATSESWWPNEIATKIIYIKGRIGFEPPVWFTPDSESSAVTSAGFGAAILIFDPSTDEIFPNEYVSREQLLEIGAPLANMAQAERDAWIAKWDEI